MGMIQNDWLDEISGEFKKPYYAQLFRFVQKEYSTYVVYPPAMRFLMLFILHR